MGKILVQSSQYFDNISNIIFKYPSLSKIEKLYLHTWFTKARIDKPVDIIKMSYELKSYIQTGYKSVYLKSNTTSHPKMFNWFGEPLRNNNHVIHVIDAIINDLNKFEDYEPNKDIVNIQDYFNKLKPDEILCNLLKINYSGNIIKFIICNELPNPYNVYPDIIAHKRVDNKKWYIAGFGHEFGHILTWDLVNDDEIRNLIKTPETKGFPEMIAHVCSKLLMDSYNYKVSDLVPDCNSWSEFGFSSKYPGFLLYKELLDVINPINQNSLKDICLETLRRYQ